MAIKYSIQIDSPTEVGHEKFLQYIKRNELAWWHWFDGHWLIVDYNDRTDETIIRDKMLEFYGNVNCMVFTIKGNYSWAGRGPMGDGNNMFDWIENTFDKA